MLIHILVLLSSLSTVTKLQSSLIWSKTNYIQTRSIKIKVTSSINQAQQTSQINFQNAFQEIPNIFFSLIRLESVTSDSFIFQSAPNITKSSFTYKITTNNHQNQIKKITSMYIALDLNAINFLFPHAMTIPITHLSSSNDPDTEYIQVQYLNALDSSKSYQIAAFLTGFNIETDQTCFIKVQAELYLLTSYLLKISAQNCFFIQIQYTRILIDRTTEASNPSGINQFNVNIGFVKHATTGNPIVTPETVTFYPESFFYGIYAFEQKFNLYVLESIFHSPNPKYTMNIFFLAIKQLACHPSEPLYNSITQTCHSSCDIQLYAVSQQQCLPCHSSCYRCDGPSITDCTDCLQGNGRKLNATGNCQCLATMIEQPSTGNCEPCRFYVVGCQICINKTHCSNCQSGCTSNGNGCTCPVICNTAAFQYKSPHTQECLCLPQYYFEPDGGVCLPCDKGCYICEGSSSNCSECIDRYYLVGSSCLYFTVSGSYFQKNPGFIFEDDRCLNKIGEQCFNQCNNPAKIFRNKCYVQQCPPQTFSIITHSADRLCHPCRAPCIQCSLYYVCDRCQPTFFYKGGTGICASCLDYCYSCQNNSGCNQCINGYRFNLISNQCQEDLPIYREGCLIGCQQCVIYQFCEICKSGYFLVSQTRECIPCRQNLTAGLQLQQPSITQLGKAVQLCKQICGDGIIYNQQCDDGNQFSGDGCSQNCVIQENYRCQYFTNYQQSVCYMSNFKLNFSMERNLTNNQIYIKIVGVGIDVSNAPFQILCSGEYQLINSSITEQNNKPTKIFTLKMFDSIQNSQCQFYLEDSAYIHNMTYVIMTEPQALVMEQTQQPILLMMKQKIFTYTFKPVAIIIWIICLLSIDPYQIWGTFYFVNLCLFMMYDYLHSIPNIYHLFQGLQYCVFNYNYQPSANPISYHNLVQSSYKILIFFAAVIAYNQILVRFLKNQTIFTVNQVSIFRSIFRHRLSTYVCVQISFEPIVLLYCSQIIKNLFIDREYSAQENALMQFSSQQIIAIIVVSLHGLCYIICTILLFVEIRQILLLKNTNDQKRYQHKFLFYIPSCKILNLLIYISIILNKSQQILISWGTLLTMLFWIILLFLDGYQEILKSSTDKLKPKNESIIQITKHSKANTVKTENIQDDECCTVGLNRQYLRKFNLFIHFSSMLIICVCRILYYSDYNIGITTNSSQNSDVESHGEYYHSKYLLFGDIISITIVLGIMILPIIFTLITHVVIIFSYINTYSDNISREIKVSIEKQEQQRRRKQMKASLGNTDQSRTDLQIIDYSEDRQSQD